jgi:hypothetical protein
MIFGESRVPFERPVQAGAGFVPRSLDTGFVPEFDPFPQIMRVPMARLPAGVHHPLTAEPGVLPAPTATTAPVETPPSATAIKRKGMHMMSPALIMALGIQPSPRRGGIRAGLDPSSLVTAGRNPGV